MSVIYFFIFEGGGGAEMRYSARVGPGSGTTPIAEFTVVFIEVLHGSHIGWQDSESYLH